MVRFCQFLSSDFCDLSFSQMRKSEWRGLALYKVLPVEEKKKSLHQPLQMCLFLRNFFQGLAISDEYERQF